MKITALTNGPLLIEGSTVLVDQNGNAYARRDPEKCALCRCGGSATKPFCDGAHVKNGFVSPPQADARAALASGEAEGGAVTPNAPPAA